MFFGKTILIWKFYTTIKTLLTIEWVQIIDKNDFVIAVLDVNNRTFVMHITIQEQKKIQMHLEKQVQI